MSSGLAVLPILCSNSIFTTRRTRNGADALSNGNPYVSLMNIDIAGGQVLKAADAVTSLAKDSNSIFANGIKCAEQSVRTLSQTDKIVSGIGKVLNFTANNINPIICATGAMKVATADDKKNAAIE